MNLLSLVNKQALHQILSCIKISALQVVLKKIILLDLKLHRSYKVLCNYFRHITLPK